MELRGPAMVVLPEPVTVMAPGAMLMPAGLLRVSRPASEPRVVGPVKLRGPAMALVVPPKLSMAPLPEAPEPWMVTDRGTVPVAVPPAPSSVPAVPWKVKDVVLGVARTVKVPL